MGSEANARAARGAWATRNEADASSMWPVRTEKVLPALCSLRFSAHRVCEPGFILRRILRAQLNVSVSMDAILAKTSSRRRSTAFMKRRSD